LYFIDNLNSLVSFEVAFFGSLSISVFSFLGYKKAVYKRLKDLEGMVIEDEEDSKETIDDENNENRLNFKDLKKMSGSSFSFLRLFAYIVFIYTILKLIDYKYFEAISFFIGLSVVPLSSLYLAWLMRKEDINTNDKN
jgi:hypothetical protein